MSHVTERHINTDFSRFEMVMGLFWLSIGAAASLLMEVVYLGTWIGGVAVPYTIVIALLFNIVLTNTAKLWSDNGFIQAIPLLVWSAGYLLLIIFPGALGSQFLGSNIRSILLLIFGVLGGMWPIIKQK
ncbi:hypothetical membrane protein [Corynebacterium kutscheri]|uniref:Hypothetical membrane protein n=1 Tax=Corynebacterium kutscheri TaxID=35755 RepID=A0A0F6R179_9CORY|nr:hypothetical protein [Corynebacterium kutscheri]AKE41725.1 hypothetical protein UL82_07820 [Corynebacterium kutscheri]VEH09001.1 hypothetical membrane protein [Corynebacterium kutscheri]VEH10052.1 hypothetical membrane protein [Corynebacterium kutscheri]VEH80133.1 hypothetical membrane protein [Corynebacterium kutscheri]